MATGFLIAAVTAAMPVSRLLSRFGPSRACLWGVGTLVGPSPGGLFAELGLRRGHADPR
ncbi:hypothetical protein [Kitasatospora sp. NPDC056184]|uniref:hypothetical protein n=1 Tax=Kitasatospora sp. NPDC056184 TaxID=3345738 RepID=UPI0035D75499